MKTILHLLHSFSSWMESACSWIKPNLYGPGTQKSKLQLVEMD